VAVLRALFILAAVAALATLPCLLTLVIAGGGGGPSRTVRVVKAVVRRCRRRHIVDRTLTRRERRGLARLDRCFGPHEAQEATPDPLPIEKLAADIRRLRRQRGGIAQRSPVWRAAVDDAYDDRLLLTCKRLEITAHLTGLTGVDREIERVRLEGELEAAGLTLHGYEVADGPRRESTP
jgi:hypothetical protein